jgi:hypothetical protein
MKKPAVMFYVLGAAALLAVVGTWAYYSGRSSQRADIVKTLSGGTDSGTEDVHPGFSADIENYSIENTLVSEWIKIENTNNQSLEISRVSLNGERDAPRAKHLYGYCVRDPEAALPVNVTIGDSTYFFIYNMNEQDASYRKEVVYIDLDTNRGNFRYTPGAGFAER